MAVKSKSKTKFKTQSRKDEKWTAKTWFKLATWYETMSGDFDLPKELRKKFAAEAEAAWVTGDLLQGTTPEMWAEQCRKEDDAFAARLRGAEVKLPSELKEEKRQAKRANYSVRNRSEKKASESTSNKKARSSQFELQLA